ncbi:hypothetical protein [Halomarina ordinaria]|uniref:Rubrerythrin-like domain-containing protein n=1 Tax=Halomarina ordinaria TaxID=3033939 RepID=A0ABD5UD92_9EURY|nr:hypothetical protein [Halomarina sp. PSRA2]
MSLLRAVVTRFDAPSDRVYECRRCGTTLDADAEACPRCDSTSIACYEF